MSSCWNLLEKNVELLALFFLSYFQFCDRRFSDPYRSYVSITIVKDFSVQMNSSYTMILLLPELYFPLTFLSSGQNFYPLAFLFPAIPLSLVYTKEVYISPSNVFLVVFTSFWAPFSPIFYTCFHCSQHVLCSAQTLFSAKKTGPHFLNYLFG